MQPRRLGKAITGAILVEEGSLQRDPESEKTAHMVGRSHEAMTNFSEKSKPEDRTDGENSYTTFRKD
jgi:hypothetical protein